MHSFEVSLGYESVARSTFQMLKMYFGQRFHTPMMKMYFGQCFHTPMKLQKNAFENVLRATLSFPNETSKECIQFL